MRHGTLTRDQAIEQVGLEAVEKVERENCEPTSRLQTDGDEAVEFSASVRCKDKDGDSAILTAYYYLTPEEAEYEDGSDVDWTIEGYEIV